jgi:2-polyprenyl-6-methoxyphenol hydroxylase-like FAD-dependent oxidoreductase
MDAIIIGGGIGGSALALALHASGVARRIRVFDAAAEMRALGIGIHIGAHAMKELSALGLEDALVATACLLDFASLPATVNSSIAVFRRGAGHQWPHICRAPRPAARLPARERIVRNFTGHAAPAWSKVRTPHRLFADPGRGIAEVMGDVLIACDGIHSAVRK